MQIIFKEDNKNDGRLYAIGTSDISDYPLWLTREDGEGMCITEKDIFDALDAWQKDNF